MIHAKRGERWLGLSEAADLIGVKPSSLRVMRSKGQFIAPAGDLGPKAPAWRESDLIAYAKSRGRNSSFKSEPVAEPAVPAETPVDNSPTPTPVDNSDKPEAEGAQLPPAPAGAEANAVMVASLLDNLERLSGPLRREVFALRGVDPSTVKTEHLEALAHKVGVALGQS